MIALLLAPALALAAPLAVVDDLGATVSLAAAPARVVSISPGATEILYALGAGGRLVGACSYCTWPKAAAACPRVGDFANPSLEAILAAKPGLVLASGGPQRELVLKLRQLGVPVLVFLPTGVAGVFTDIRALGRVFGRARAAERLVGDMEREIRAVAAQAPAGRRPVVYFEIWADPLMAIGDLSYAGELIRLAGGENVARGVAGDYPRLAAERVIAGNPDVIILSHCDDPAHAVELLAGRPGWANVAAVRAGRVWCDLDMDLLLRPGPRLVLGLKQLAAKLRAPAPGPR